MPDKIDESDPAVAAKVKEVLKEVDDIEDERLKAERDFEKVVGKHQRGLVMDIKENAGVIVEEKGKESEAAPPQVVVPARVPVPKIALGVEGDDERKEPESEKEFANMFSSIPVNASTGFSVTDEQELPPNLFKPELERLSAENNTDEMKAHRKWVVGEDGPGGKKLPPKLRSSEEVLQEERGIEDGISFAKRQLLKKRKEADEAAAALIKEIQLDQERRRKEYEEEDKKLLRDMERKKEEARKARLNEDLQRRLEVERAEMKLVQKGIVGDFDPRSSTAVVGADGKTTNDDQRVTGRVQSMPPTFLEEQPDLPSGFKVSVQKTDQVLSGLEEEQKEAESMGLMRIEDYHKLKKDQAQAQLDREMKLRTMEASEQEKLFNEMASKIQICYRGRAGRKKAREVRLKAKKVVEEAKAALKIQVSEGCEGGKTLKHDKNIAYPSTSLARLRNS